MFLSVGMWSHSLPRRNRRVTFNDEKQDETEEVQVDDHHDHPPPPLPSRPPPPAPVRGQSLNAMKDMSSFSQTYNGTLRQIGSRASLEMFLRDFLSLPAIISLVRAWQSA